MGLTKTATPPPHPIATESPVAVDSFGDQHRGDAPTYHTPATPAPDRAAPAAGATRDTRYYGLDGTLIGDARQPRRGGLSAGMVIAKDRSVTTQIISRTTTAR